MVGVPSGGGAGQLQGTPVNVGMAGQPGGYLIEPAGSRLNHRGLLGQHGDERQDQRDEHACQPDQQGDGGASPLAGR